MKWVGIFEWRGTVEAASEEEAQLKLANQLKAMLNPQHIITWPDE